MTTRLVAVIVVSSDFAADYRIVRDKEIKELRTSVAIISHCGFTLHFHGRQLRRLTDAGAIALD